MEYPKSDGPKNTTTKSDLTNRIKGNKSSSHSKTNHSFSV